MDTLIITGEIIFAAAVFTVAAPTLTSFAACTWLCLSLGFATNVDIQPKESEPTRIELIDSE